MKTPEVGGGTGSAGGATTLPTSTTGSDLSDPDSFDNLAAQTHFSIAEVQALSELYSKLSNELHRDNLIHRDEFMWALFKANRDNLFADRVFELFDIKRNHVIEFGEFVRSLSVFHPKAPLEDKAYFAFRIYDLKQNGVIERSELRRFLVELMADNPDVDLDEQALDVIVDETFAELDLASDDRISPDEWLRLVRSNPDVISYMTLPVLTQLEARFPTPKKSNPPAAGLVAGGQQQQQHAMQAL